MDRVKHNIAVVLALFGVVFIAPAALAQTTAGGGAAIPAQEFYIGGTVVVPSGATSGEYTGTYEVMFTIVP